MDSDQIKALEAALRIHRTKLNCILDSASSACRAGCLQDIRSTIATLKANWKDFSSVSVSLRALRQNADDVVGAGLLKGERKTMAGNIESVVCLLNQSLREAGVDLESEFNNSVSSSISQASLIGEDIEQLTHENGLLDTGANYNLERLGSDISVLKELQPRTIRQPEHVLLEKERASGRLFQHWLRLSLEMSYSSNDGAHACLTELRLAFNWRRNTLNELIEFHLKRGEVTSAGQWRDRLRLDEAGFHEVVDNMDIPRVSINSNPFLQDTGASSFSGFDLPSKTSSNEVNNRAHGCIPKRPSVVHCSSVSDTSVAANIVTLSAGQLGNVSNVAVDNFAHPNFNTTNTAGVGWPASSQIQLPVSPLKLAKPSESLCSTGLTDFFDAFVDKYDAGFYSVFESHKTMSTDVRSSECATANFITTSASSNRIPKVRFSDEFGHSCSAIPDKLTTCQPPYSEVNNHSSNLRMEGLNLSSPLHGTNPFLNGESVSFNSPEHAIASTPRLHNHLPLLRDRGTCSGTIGNMHDWTYNITPEQRPLEPPLKSAPSSFAGAVFESGASGECNPDRMNSEHMGTDSGDIGRLTPDGRIPSLNAKDKAELGNEIRQGFFQRKTVNSPPFNDSNVASSSLNSNQSHGNAREPPTSEGITQSCLYPYQVLLETELLRGRGDKFTGKVDEYISWRDRMLEYINRAGSSHRTMMEILLANTEGGANRVVRQLLRSQLSPNLQVKKLWEHFESRCGSGMVLSKSQLDWLRRFPRICSPTEIDRMDELLTFCYSISEGVHSSSSITYLLSPEGQREVWEKMPEPFVERWRRSCGCLRRKGVEPTMALLIAAISDYVEERADPYFSDRSSKPSKTHTVLKTTTTTQESNEDLTDFCHLHKIDGHKMSDCRQFAKLPVTRRWDTVRRLELCFVCFEPHMARDCKSGKACSECNNSHHDLLHPAAASEINSNRVAVNQAISNCARLCSSEDDLKCCSKTLPVQIRLVGQQKAIRCLCILDEQSNTSFCDVKLLDMLGLKGVEEDYMVSTMAGLKSRLTGAIIDDLEVKGDREDAWIPLPLVRSHPSLPDTTKEIATRDVVLAHSHLRQFAKNFPRDVYGLEVLLLVGANCGPAMRTEIFGNTYPFAHHTALGWALVGPACVKKERVISKCLRTGCVNEHFEIEPAPLRSIYRGEVFPSRDPFKERNDDDMIGLSQEDQQFLQKLEDGTIVNESGNLEFPLPLKDQPTFQNNKRPVFIRTRNTLSRIRRKPILAERCSQAMDKYIAAGHVEQLTSCDAEPSGMVNYIPVMPVEHLKKKKVRIVFDSSASYGGSSLNDNLLRGPDINNRLLGVLLRFRLFRIAFTSDVECMFHCFYVKPEHRNLLRFFWWDNNVPGDKLAIFRANVHVFGNRSSPAVAVYGLRYVTTLPDVDPTGAASQFIRNNFYVDDGMASLESASEATDMLLKSRELLSRFNIRLHKISSPSVDVLRAFPSSEVASSAEDINICSPIDQTALGMGWKLTSDEICVRYTVVHRAFTKRGILSLIQSIFDPLGILSPVVLAGRLLQRSFIAPLKEPSSFHEYGWDDPLPLAALPSWERWTSELPGINEVKIPRCYASGVGSASRNELHIFADASSVAIGFVAYMRRIDHAGNLDVGFVLASSKVSPRAATSIPRLELCAAVEAAQASRRLEEELSPHVSKVHFYTDSLVVMGYLRNKSKAFSRYVTARVRLILSVSCAPQWNYISSAENPADIACRPCSVTELLRTNWFQGPSFLYRPDLPKEESLSNDVILPEVVTNTQCLFVQHELDPSIFYHFRLVSRTWMTMIRIVAYVWRFIRNCQSMYLGFEEANKISIITLIRLAQDEGFPKEKQFLKKNVPLPENCAILSLAPFLDGDSLLRVGGRLANADIPYEEKHPILLPPEHFITLAILDHFHEKCFHQGRLITMSFLRRAGFHIHKQKSTVSKYLRRCILCRKLRGQPETQIMANLPADRLGKVPPFYHSGVDVFGPYLVHDGKVTRRTTASKKIWVVLFTCLYCRAVHVEPLGALDSSTFQFALRRFMAIRGECKLFRSDRGTNFVGLENQRLSKELESLIYPTEDSNAQWKFLPPGASHFAGVWERKIGSIKRILDVSLSLLGSSSLSREEFTTLIQEAATIVNQTPLADISSDPNDPFPVSPAALLTLREGSDVLSEFDESDLSQYGRKRWRRVQYLAQQFWLRWRRDYLRSMDHRRKWKTERRNLKVGDVVLIRDKTSRCEWPMGIVMETYPDRNGFVRRVSLRRRDRKSDKCKLIERAISDLVLLIPVERS